jgi:hypothetical protein
MKLKFSFDNNKINIDIHDEDKHLLKKIENGVHFIGTYFRLTYMSKYNSHTKYLLYFLIKESDNEYIIFPLLLPLIFHETYTKYIPLIAQNLRKLFNNMKLNPNLRITQILYEVSNLNISDKVYLNFMFGNYENLIKSLIREYYPYFDHNDYITIEDIYMEYGIQK